MKMSNLKRITIVLFMLMLTACTTVIFAQASGDPPNISLEIFFSIPALVAFVIPVTAIIKKSILKNSKATQYLSWVVSILASGIGYYLNAGIFMNMSWYYILIYGFAVGLISNGLFDWKLVQKVLQLFKLYNKKLI